MEQTTFHTLMLVATILGAFWYLKSEIGSLRKEISDNRTAITNVRVELAEIKGFLHGFTSAQSAQTRRAAAK